MIDIQKIGGDEKKYRIVFSFYYKEEVESIRITFYKGIDKINMTRNKNDKHWWKGEIVLNGGVYLYKYAINSLIRVNDPDAQEYEMDSIGEVWSKLIVNDKTYIAENTCLQLYETQISSMHNFNTTAEVYTITVRKIYLAVNLKATDRLHSISVIWYQGDGKIIRYEERAIKAEGYDLDKIYRMIFLLQISVGIFVVGTCKVDILFDGRHVAVKYFQILNNKENVKNYINITI